MTIKNRKFSCLDCGHEWRELCGRDTIYFGLGYESTYYPCSKTCVKCSSRNIKYRWSEFRGYDKTEYKEEEE